MVSSDLQDSKHDRPRISTDDGITINFSPDEWNDDSSIRINFESFPNVTDSSELQYSKHDLQRISTDDGIKIDFNPLR
jgi:hypothetical protein